MKEQSHSPEPDAYRAMLAGIKEREREREREGGGRQAGRQTDRQRLPILTNLSLLIYMPICYIDIK